MKKASVRTQIYSKTIGPHMLTFSKVLFYKNNKEKPCVNIINIQNHDKENRPWTFRNTEISNNFFICVKMQIKTQYLLCLFFYICLSLSLFLFCFVFVFVFHFNIIYLPWSSFFFLSYFFLFFPLNI